MQKDTKLLQYADDATVVLADENSASAFLSLLDSLKGIFGLRINCTKTEDMGSSKKYPYPPPPSTEGYGNSQGGIQKEAISEAVLGVLREFFQGFRVRLVYIKNQKMLC